MREILFVFIGGGVGSVLRYGLSPLIGRSVSTAFPVPTLLVNILGCLLIGLFYAFSERWNMSSEIRLLLTVGLCGGFTTFSTFSNEALSLLKSGLYVWFICYILLSVVLGLLAAFAGYRLGH